MKIPAHNLFLKVNPYDEESTEFYLQPGVSYGYRRSSLARMRTGDSVEFCSLVANGRDLSQPHPTTQYRAYRMVGEPITCIDEPSGQTQNRYAIVYPSAINLESLGPNGSLHGFFRVVNLWTGAESTLYSLQQCHDIINLALHGELRGSFN